MNEIEIIKYNARKYLREVARLSFELPRMSKAELQKQYSNYSTDFFYKEITQEEYKTYFAMITAELQTRDIDEV